MRGERVLILGGTADARLIADVLIEDGFAPITSLAGVTRHPVMPKGEVHIGGFGGPAGLAAFLKREDFAAVIDATHPFAVRISRHAVAAALDVGVPCLRFERPAWQAQEGDQWLEVAGLTQAIAALPAGARPLVTVGRKEISQFFARADLRGVARMIEVPDEAVPDGWTLLLERPPFSEASERTALAKHRITHLVTKNSGGEATRSKLDAARALHLPVIMIARPPKPKAEAFSTVSEAGLKLRRTLSP